jgi:hypothetical protein
MEMAIDVRGDNELGIRGIRNDDESDLKLWDPADGWSCQHIVDQNNSIVSVYPVVFSQVPMICRL